MKLDVFDACNLVALIEDGKGGDTIMMNGLPLRQCSREYIGSWPMPWNLRWSNSRMNLPRLIKGSACNDIIANALRPYHRHGDEDNVFDALCVEFADLSTNTLTALANALVARPYKSGRP